MFFQLFFFFFFIFFDFFFILASQIIFLPFFQQSKSGLDFQHEINEIRFFNSGFGPFITILGHWCRGGEATPSCKLCLLEVRFEQKNRSENRFFKILPRLFFLFRCSTSSCAFWTALAAAAFRMYSRSITDSITFSKPVRAIFSIDFWVYFVVKFIQICVLWYLLVLWIDTQWAINSSIYIVSWGFPRCVIQEILYRDQIHSLRNDNPRNSHHLTWKGV